MAGSVGTAGCRDRVKFDSRETANQRRGNIVFTSKHAVIFAGSNHPVIGEVRGFRPETASQELLFDFRYLSEEISIYL